MNHNSQFHLQLNRLMESLPPQPSPIRPFHPLLLYGCGALGELALQLLKRANITPVGMIDAAEKWKNQTFHNLPVFAPTEVPNAWRSTCTTAICIANYPIGPITELLTQNGFQDIRHIYDITEQCGQSTDIGNGWYLPSPDETKIRQFHQCLDLWADNESRYAFLQFIGWHTRRIELLSEDAPVRLHDKYRPKGILEQLPDQVHLFDIGAYDGMAIKRITRDGMESLASIQAFEPDPQNFQRLQEYCQANIDPNQCPVTLHRNAIAGKAGHLYFATGRDLASKVTSRQSDVVVSSLTLNDFTNTAKCNYLKIHAEGAEPDIISAASEFLCHHRPITAITVYHDPESSSQLPIELSHILADYLFYFRLHSYCGTGAVLYALPVRK